ncbi:hypothetical protein AB0I81_09840 [Nonomuraea sp. NPDC050404]|uniref:hypothetical protein n=1 Tax=Nonomuraea sp. NPDC050404 TaxID=3155783 RepID=UPI0033C5D277
MLGRTGRKRMLAAAAMVAMLGLTAACNGDGDDGGDDDPDVVNTQAPDGDNDQDGGTDQDQNEQDDNN